jgi:hypothetical protein
VALSFLVVFWLLYDADLPLFGQKKNGDAIVGALVLGWCAWRRGWPATGLPGAPPSCWWAR